MSSEQFLSYTMARTSWAALWVWALGSFTNTKLITTKKHCVIKYVTL